MSGNERPDVPLAPEAVRLLAQLRPKLQGILSEVSKIPVSILLWGPSSGHPLAHTISELRRNLRKQGHAALLGKELLFSDSHSTEVQQLAQARELDIIVSFPCTAREFNDAHNFASDKRTRARIFIFLCQEQLASYNSNDISALKTISACQLEFYPNFDCCGEFITPILANELQRVRELKFRLRGRY